MNNKKALYLSLIIVFGFALGSLVSLKIYKAKSAKLPQIPSQAKKADSKPRINRNGIMTASFDSSVSQVGEQVEAKIEIDTQGDSINGYDALLKYDPLAWDAASLKAEIMETAFATTAYNKIDKIKGEISFSGLTEVGESFNGKTVVAVLLMTPKKSGKLALDFVFDGQGAGNDSNMAQVNSGNDVLGRVVNGLVEAE